MANESEVRAKTENLDKIVGDFKDKLDLYLKNMNQRTNEITGLFNELAKNWSGKPYNDFKDKMTKPRNNIAASITKGQRVSEQLKEIKVVLSQALEMMRKGGER